MPLDADVGRNLDAVRRRIRAAADRGKHPADTIQLVAVSKTFGPDAVRAAARAGHRAFGENRVQEALGKMDALADLALDWHLIGHLQSNKARRTAGRFGWIESIDSLELLAKLETSAADVGAKPRILIQVDLAGEASKSGIPPAGVRPLIDAALGASALDLQGLMLVPPIPDRPDDSRPWFRALRELRDALVADGVPRERLAHLSMGMSEDFEVAIEEGATIVRIGTAIFGSRPQPTPLP